MGRKALERALPIVAASLGRKFGVKVVVGGSDAYTNGDRIQIPAHDPDDTEFADVAYGFLSHEAAHIRYSNFEVAVEAASSDLRKALTNAIEDARIERALGEAYPGTPATIAKAIGRMADRGQFGPVQEGEHPGEMVHNYVLVKLRGELLGQAPLDRYLAQSEPVLEATFSPGVVTRLNGLLAKVSELNSTRDSLRLADRILSMLEEAAQSSEDQGGQPNGSDGDGQRSSDSSQQNSQDAPGTPGSDGSSAEQPGDGRPGSAEGSVSRGDSEAAGGVAGSEAGDAGADSQENAGSEQAPSNQGDGSGLGSGEEVAEAIRRALAAGPGDLSDGAFERVGESLEAQADSEAYGGATIVTAEPGLVPAMGNGDALLAEVKSESGYLRARLNGLVQSAREDRSISKARGRRIRGKDLARLPMGDPRVFEDRTRRQRPNTAVHLLVDFSGSMGNHAGNGRPRAKVAAQAALALATGLEGIPGVSVGVTGFNGFPSQGVKVMVPQGGSVRGNAALFQGYASGGTPLGTGLWFGLNQVIQRDEPRKVLIAVTDGQAHDRPDTVVRFGQRYGVEFYGIGIEEPFVYGIFPVATVINDVTELRSRLFEVARQALAA